MASLVIRNTLNLLQRAIHSERMEANAFFLWATAITSAAAGFLFWNISARFYTTDDVGVASSAISLMMLLSGITSLGIGTGLVRFLKAVDEPVTMVNTALTFTFLTSILFGSICVLGTDIWSPGLIMLKQPCFFIIFLLLVISTTHFIILQMVFLSLMQSSATLWMVILLNGVRLAILMLFRIEGAQGIVVSLAVATVLSDLMAFLLLRNLLLHYRLGIALSGRAMQRLIPYSLVSGTADFLSRVPAMLAPLLAMELINASASARVYIAWMMGSMVLSPSTSLAQSAFSKGSAEPDRLDAILRRSGEYSLFITILLALIVFMLADRLLGFFGEDYRSAVPALQWMCAAAPLFAVNSLLATAFRVQNRLWILILSNLAVIAAFITPQELWLRKIGLSVTGSAWLIAQGIALLLCLAVFIRFKPPRGATASLAEPTADHGVPE